MLRNKETIQLNFLKYAKCTRAIPTQQNYKSCMATLLYHDDDQLALQRCQLDVIELPLTQKARNLGFGRWLFTSSHGEYALIESAGNRSNPLARIEHLGCRVGIITLWKTTKSAKFSLTFRLNGLRSSTSVNSQLQDSISSRFNLLLLLHELPNFSWRSEAQIQIL